MSREAVYTFNGELLHKTDDAFLVLIDGEKHWLPKTQTEDHRDGSFTIPEWLAIKKEMV